MLGDLISGRGEEDKRREERKIIRSENQMRESDERIR